MPPHISNVKQSIYSSGNLFLLSILFKKEGTCTQTTIVTDEEGKEHKTEVRVKWAFYDQSSSTIYFGEDHYWDIEELTSRKFAVYDRWGEYGEIHMFREYKELTSLK